jgi:hypothetical protein
VAGERIPVPHIVRQRLAAAGRLKVFRGGLFIQSHSSPFSQGVPMRPLSFPRFTTLAVAGGLMLFAALPVSAESIINLGTGIQESIEPGGSGSFTFTLSNVGTTTVPDDFLSWVLGIQLIPLPGTTGTLTLGTLSAGTTNPMPVGGVDISQPALRSLGAASINGSSDYYFMQIAAAEQFGTVSVGQTYEMGSLALTASPDAQGAWDVYTVQQNGNLRRTYFFDGVNDEKEFGNIPFNGGDYSLPLGTVEVVPEPSSVALLGLAGLGAGGYALRRRSRKAAAAGEVIAA